MKMISKTEKIILDKFVKEMVDDGPAFYKYQDKIYLLNAKEMNNKQIEVLKKTRFTEKKILRCEGLRWQWKEEKNTL